ncbi:MAG: protein phosphatase CheZ [Rhodobacteraceae bacterium]|nr:protein phosphatase CheZ [Paracoccaceae bacterium]
MQNAEAQSVETPIGEAEYQTLEQTLMESERGRKFLKEYLTRHKTPETQEILAAIKRLEKGMSREGKAPNMDAIRLDIAEMHEAIERTKKEIANIKAENDAPNRFVDASHELDAIVTQTEGATSTILESAEKIQEIAWNLREAGAAEESCDEIDAMATEIFMACSFQDLTGQRTTKVVHVLRYLESRINTMINIWGLAEVEVEDMDAPVDTRPDAHLLNGPQLEGEGVSQGNVDDLFASADTDEDEGLSADEISFDKIETDTVADEADIDAIMSDEASQEPMAADDIDAMFDAPAADDDSEDEVEAADEVETEVAEPEADAPEEEVAVALAEEEISFETIGEGEPEVEPVIEDLDTAENSIQFEEDDASVELDTTAIEQMFDAEIEEASADVAWEQAESDDAEDPMESMTEAERQALFN